MCHFLQDSGVLPSPFFNATIQGDEYPENFVYERCAGEQSPNTKKCVKEVATSQDSGWSHAEVEGSRISSVSPPRLQVEYGGIALMLTTSLEVEYAGISFIAVHLKSSSDIPFLRCLANSLSELSCQFSF